MASRSGFSHALHFLVSYPVLVFPLCEECRHDVLHAGPGLVEQHDTLLPGLYESAGRMAWVQSDGKTGTGFVHRPGSKV